MNQDIIIEDYSQTWPLQFEAMKNVYEQLLGTLLQSVEHVGSTSVPGLAAKPVLDIDLVISNEDQLPAVIRILQHAGYLYRGDLGIKDRYAFKALNEHAPDNGTKQQWPAHHLYCCIAGSTSLINHIVLRNALRRDATLRSDYEVLKKKLAASVQGDIDAYVEGKSIFISEVLRSEGLSTEEIAHIILQNKKK